MRLLQLRLHHFRNYGQLIMRPPAGVTAFVGANGAGKTNILEAIHLCCLGRSHRTSRDHDMIQAGQTTAAVHAKVERQPLNDEVGVRLYAGAAQKKLVYVNGRTVGRIGEMMGHLCAVMFSPEDLDIAKGGPVTRRRFLDMLLSQSQPAYFYNLQHYYSVLKQRNALLRAMWRGEAQELDVWDEQLAQAAAPLVRLRRDAASALDNTAHEHYLFLSGQEKEAFSLRYHGTLSESADPAQDYLALLHKQRAEDIRRQSTQNGPHRDDLVLSLSGQELKSFASQGQMRTAVLALRLAQMNLLTQALGEPPLLLLDDVLSELDDFRKTRLIERLEKVQTFITATEWQGVKDVKPDAVLTVENGEIKS